MELRLLTVLTPLALVLMLGGCGENSDKRMTKLEHRVANLEAANRDLEGANRDLSNKLAAQTLALRSGLKKLDNRSWMNESALLTGLSEAQYRIACGFNPQGPPGAGGCHVALGEPGAVYTDTTKPRRIFVTPLSP